MLRSWYKLVTPLGFGRYTPSVCKSLNHSTMHTVTYTQPHLHKLTMNNYCTEFHPESKIELGLRANYSWGYLFILLTSCMNTPMRCGQISGCNSGCKFHV